MNKLIIKNNLVNNRENIHLEFKESFTRNVRTYIKSVCAFANNKGGCIVFGVKDKPRIPNGLNDFNKFNDYDSKDFATEIQNCLSIYIDFEFSYFEQNINDNFKKFGVIKIKELDQKPVICKISDNSHKLREGAIYFRYSAKSEEIKAQDLIRLIQIEKDKEKELWIKNIQKMAQIGVRNSGLFSYDGEIFAGERKVIIDKDIIDKIKFIKEGHFTEREGTPALILKGEIQNLDSLEIINTTSDPNITHPFEGIKSVENDIISRNKDLKEISFLQNNKTFKLVYIIQKIKKELNLEENIIYCWKNKKGTVKKYSQSFISKIEEYLNDKSILYNLIIK